MYNISGEVFKSGALISTYSDKIYVGEDSTNHSIFVINHLPFVWYLGGATTVNFDNSDNTAEWFDGLRGNVHSFVDGTINIGGISLPKYSVDIPNKGKSFFKAKGIGGPYGPFGSFSNLQYYGNGGYIVSMDFIHGDDSLHFDY